MDCNAKSKFASTAAVSTASVCGLGAVTGYGWGRKLLEEGLYTGWSAVERTPGFSEFFPFEEGWVARVADGGDPELGRSRFVRATRSAAGEAVGDALDRGWRPGPVVGVVHGLVLSDPESWRDYNNRDGHCESNGEWVGLMPSTVLSEFNQQYGFHGPTMGVNAMCASGLAAVLTAKTWMDAGMADDVVVIVSDLSMTVDVCSAFAKLGVLVADVPALDGCRPFQVGSRGFPGGEAAVAMVLSNRREGEYARVLGGAMSHDAYHAISVAPDHQVLLRTFERALASAGVAPCEVAYLNAHGPGTRQCDEAEAHVLDTLLTEARGMYSVKPLTGHCQGAASMVETLAAIFGFENHVVPAPRQVSTGHPRLLDGPTRAVEGAVVKSSLGMGGTNAVLVLGGPE